jgi:hypothetical protein
MKDAVKKPSETEAPDRSASKATWRTLARNYLAGRLRPYTAPLLERIVRHQVTIRRWGGLGGLAIGLGLMAGGLGPLGLSFVFAAVAVLLLELEERRRGRDDGARK